MIRSDRRAASAVAAATVAATLAAASAFAQERPSVTGYLQQGYQVIHSSIGGQFLVFVLKKDNANSIVYCTVTIQTGDTAACKTVR